MGRLVYSPDLDGTERTRVENAPKDWCHNRKCLVKLERLTLIRFLPDIRLSARPYGPVFPFWLLLGLLLRLHILVLSPSLPTSSSRASPCSICYSSRWLWYVALLVYVPSTVLSRLEQFASITSQLVEASVAVTRIRKFLLSEELQTDARIVDEGEVAEGDVVCTQFIYPSGASAKRHTGYRD